MTESLLADEMLPEAKRLHSPKAGRGCRGKTGRAKPQPQELPHRKVMLTMEMATYTTKSSSMQLPCSYRNSSVWQP